MLTEAGGEVSGLSDSLKSTKLFIFLISFGSTDIRLPLISSFTSLRYVSSIEKYDRFKNLIERLLHLIMEFSRMFTLKQLLKQL